MSEKALVILECEEVFENKQLFPSNDSALQPRGLRSRHTWKSLYAPRSAAPDGSASVRLARLKARGRFATTLLLGPISAPFQPVKGDRGTGAALRRENRLGVLAVRIGHVQVRFRFDDLSLFRLPILVQSSR